MKAIYEKDLQHQSWHRLASPAQRAFYEWAVAQGAEYAFLLLEYSPARELAQRLRITKNDNVAYLIGEQWSGAQRTAYKKVLLCHRDLQQLQEAFNFEHNTGQPPQSGAYVSLFMFHADLPSQSHWTHQSLHIPQWESHPQLSALMALLTQILAEAPVAHGPLLSTVPNADQPPRQIETARSLDAINTAVKAGFRTVLKAACPAPPFYTQDVLMRHRDTGLYQLKSYLKPKIDAAWQTVKHLRYCPPRFAKPFAAYVVPEDIQIGERVYIADVIEDLLGSIDSETGSELRLNHTYGRWNGKDFYLEHPDLQPTKSPHWVEGTIYCNSKWPGTGKREHKAKTLYSEQICFFYETQTAEAEAAYRFALHSSAYHGGCVTLFVKKDKIWLTYDAIDAPQGAAPRCLFLEALQAYEIKKRLAKVRFFDGLQQAPDETGISFFALEETDQVWRYCSGRGGDKAVLKLYEDILWLIPRPQPVPDSQTLEASTEESIRTITTVRSIEALNEGVQQGFRPYLENAVCAPPFQEKVSLGWNRLSRCYGYCPHPARYYEDYKRNHWEIILHHSYYPVLFQTGFAAYLLPPDLKPGERVWIPDLIIDLLGGGNDSVGTRERLPSAYACWNGASFDIEYRPEDIGFAIG